MSDSESAHTLAVFYGAVVNPQSISKYDLLPRALAIIGSNGNILHVVHNVESHDVQKVIDHHLHEIQESCKKPVRIELTELKDGEFIIPGFVDTHTHAPQVPNMGIGGQYPLLEWLKNVTYPMEGNFKDADFAKAVYPDVVRRFIAFGTTTCCYYGSSHLESTKVLAKAILKLGQRAFVGKCNMDRDCPDDVREPSVTTAFHETKAIISYIRSLESDFVRPILTPRFAIACNGCLLRGLGDIAKSDSTLAIQTHISENKQEIKDTLELFPDRTCYADVYDHYGLMSERTILGHGVYLTDLDLDIIKDRNAGVSHCPTSNFNLTSGMAKVAEMLDRGIKVGLGTDVSGGFAPSMLTVIQHASMCAKMVALQAQKNSNHHHHRHKHSGFAGKPFRTETLLYLATVGGASLCCMEDKIGSFAPGKSFDALIVSVRPEIDNPAIWSMPSEFSSKESKRPDSCSQEAKEKLEARLERFLFGGDDRNILKVFVQGRCIGGKAVHRYSEETKKM